MRLYTFTNMYLSSVQKGIQSAHLVHQLFVKYPPHFPEGGVVWTWAYSHQTMVVLNGGYSSNLRSVFQTLSGISSPFPHAQFHEEDDALDGALTCVGVILPERIYDTASDLRRNNISVEAIASSDYNKLVSLDELDIVNLLLNHSLAN